MQPLPENDLNHILEHTRDLWEELRGEQLFITGGTGFFGCWLLESFLWANRHLKLDASATVLSRFPEKFAVKMPHLANNPAIRFIKGDVLDFEFPQGTYGYIIHAATDTNTKEPSIIFDTIVEGTRHTLEFAQKCGAQKFLLTSSGAIYGKQPPEMTHIPEEYPGGPYPTDPHSAYGEGKRAAETLCTLYSKQFGLEAKIARCFAFVGPYLPLDSHFAIGNFIRDGLNGGPIIVQGDGTPHRSYLYASDLAIWLWTILFKSKSCRPYNVGSENAVSIKNLAHLVADCFQPSPPIQVKLQQQDGGTPEHYIPLTQRALFELNLQESINLQDSIKLTIQWTKHNRDGKV